MVSGDRQEGIPGVMLAGQLVVRLTDPLGAVAGVPVTWRVLAGAGDFLPSTTTITDANGEARVSFTPETDRTTVTAAIDKATVTPVEFRTVPRSASYTRVSAPTTCYGSCERFVLYVDGTFALRYSHVEFLGTFTRRDSALTLMFGADAGWVATGFLRSDSLSVTYNTRMSLSDFEDALFLLVPGTTSATRP
ncbi:MAG TPA: Ig-like domain-containing protein [Gemmatimonadales bacterium]|nr:Ig-like domain-containing protein [Gemmatimonadales bacterium]